MIKIAIVDDQSFVQDALDVYIQARAQDVMAIVATGVSVAALIECAREVPDVTLLDFYLEDHVNPRDNIRRLREWGSEVVMISADDQSAQLRWTALDEGAHSFLCKNDGLDAMRTAIEKAAAGEPYVSPSHAKHIRTARLGLTMKQEEAAALIAAGLTNVEIASRMSIGTETVKGHIERIKEHYLRAGRPPVESRKDLIKRLFLDGFRHGR